MEKQLDGTTVKTYTTVNGTQITVSDGGIVSARDRSCHITRFYSLEESPERKVWEEAFRKGGVDFAKIGCVSSAYSKIVIFHAGNEEIVSDILQMARAAREQIAAEDARREAALKARREAVIAACPAGFEPAETTGWHDGTCFYKSLCDGATHLNWDSAYSDQGCGIFYVPAEKFADNRKQKAEAEAEKTKKEAETKAKYEKALAEAQSTGKPVILNRWTTVACMNDNDDECSCDNATEWLYPDGKKKVTYHCNY